MRCVHRKQFLGSSPSLLATRRATVPRGDSAPRCRDGAEAVAGPGLSFRHVLSLPRETQLPWWHGKGTGQPGNNARAPGVDRSAPRR